MINSIFKKLIPSGKNQIIIYEINDRIGPIDRHLAYTQELENFLEENKWGKVVNEGTYLSENREISGCDIHIQIASSAINNDVISRITIFLEKIGMPKGSTLRMPKTGKKKSVGKMEGLALYLNKEYTHIPGLDIEKFAQEIHNNIGHTNTSDRSWSNDEVDAVYFYNTSFEEMKRKLKVYLAEYNLTGYEKIVQIA